MVKCSVVGCTNDNNVKYPGISFHSFPKNLKLRLKWLKAINRPDFKPSKASKICSYHFMENDINYTLNRQRLKDDVCPVLHIPRGKSSTPPSIHEHEVTSSSSKHNDSNSVAVESMPKNNSENLVTSGHTKYSVASGFNENGGEVENQFYDAPMGSSSETESAMSLSSTTSQRDSTNMNQELKRICRKQRKEIRRLKEIVRKQRKKLATFTNILKILTKQRS